MNENKDNFLTSLRKDLEKDLNYLKKEKQEEEEKYQKEVRELVRKELEEKITTLTQQNKAQQEQLEEQKELLKKEIQEKLTQIAAEDQKSYQEILKQQQTQQLALETERQANAKRFKEKENKFKQLYYWLFGIFFLLLSVIIGVFFALRGSAGK